MINQIGFINTELSQRRPVGEFPWESDTELLEHRMYRAYGAALTYEEHESMQRDVGKFAEYYKSKDIEIAKVCREGNRQLNTLGPETNHFVLFTNPKNLLNLLKLRSMRLDADKVLEGYHHELQHWQQAISEGFTRPTIGLYLYKEADGKFMAGWCTLIGMDNPEWRDDEYMEKRYKVIMAPDNPSLADHTMTRPE